MAVETLDPPVAGVPDGLEAEPVQPPVKGVPDGLTAEPLPKQPAVKGVPAGLTAEELPAKPNAPAAVQAPAQPDSFLTDMTKVAGATPGTQSPEQAVPVRHSLAPSAQTYKEQGAREGWMPGSAYAEQNKPFLDWAAKPIVDGGEKTDLTPSAQSFQKKWTAFKAAHPTLAAVIDPVSAEADWEKLHPNIQASHEAVKEFAQGMTSPTNIAMLAAMPESKVISAFFTAQAAHGAYKDADAAFDAFRQGKNPEATKYATSAGLNALMALAAGAHAGGVGKAANSGEVPRGTSVEQSAPESHPPIGETEPETDRTVLHQSPRPEVTQAAATAEHPAVKETIEDAVKPINGASLAGARDEKAPERVEEKIDDGQSPRTVRDFSGFRVAVDTPEAKDQVVDALKKNFEVVDEQDEFEKGNEDTGFHGHTLQVREPGSPVSHEVQILPREVAETADERHGLYEKARDGDEDAAAQMKAANESDWQRFTQRNANTETKGGRGESPEPPVAEPSGSALAPEAVGRAALSVPGGEPLESDKPLPKSRSITEMFWPSDSKSEDLRRMGVEREIAESRRDLTTMAEAKADLQKLLKEAEAKAQILEAGARQAPYGDPNGTGRAQVAAEVVRRLRAKLATAKESRSPQLEAPEPKQEPKFKFGSTQANIPADSEAAQALKTAREKIAPEDRGKEVNGAEGGIETEPHVTVRYGLKGDDTAGIRKFIESQAPFEATLGKTDKFEPSEHSDGMTPIIAPIESPELHRIEAELDQHGDFSERSFPEYKPHATLGYVKPESAEKYVGMAETEGKKFPVKSIAISDRNGNLEEIPLKGGANGTDSPGLSPREVRAGEAYLRAFREVKRLAEAHPEVSPWMKQPGLQAKRISEVVQHFHDELPDDVRETLMGMPTIMDRETREELSPRHSWDQFRSAHFHELAGRAESYVSDRNGNLEEIPLKGGRSDGNSQKSEGNFHFKTALGSEYQVHEDGTTTRNKAFRPEHGKAEQGPQPRSDRTFYVTPADAEKLGEFQTTGSAKKSISVSGTHAGVRYMGGPDAGKMERRTFVPIQTEPAKGLIPVETWGSGLRAHFGNEITEVTKPETSQPGKSSQSGKKITTNVAKGEPWTKGEPFVIRDPATGDYKAGEVSYYNEGKNGSKPGGRVRVGSSSIDEIPPAAVRIKGADQEIKSISGTPEEQEVIDRTKRDLPKLAAQYLEKFSEGGVPTLATDAAKELLPEFRADPTNNDRITASSGKAIRDVALKTVLAEPVDPAKPDVLITTASPGSGKTTGQSAGGNPEGIGIKVEAISDDYKSFSKLVRQVVDSGRTPVIQWVYVDDPAKTVQRMFRRAIGHGEKPGIGRTVQLKYMADAYTNVPKVLEQIQKEFGDKVQIHVVDNSGLPGQHTVTEDIGPYIEKIKQNDYDQVVRRMDEALGDLQKEGLFESQRGQDILRAARAIDSSTGQSAGGSGSGPVREAVEQGRPENERRPEVPGPVLETPKSPAKRTRLDLDMDEAKVRPVAQNIKRATIDKPTEKLPADVPARVLSPDAYQIFQKMQGRGYDWSGATLPSGEASKFIAKLRGVESKARQLGDRATAEAAKKLALSLDSARDAEGGLVLLAPDYDASTLREELAHRWQAEAGLVGSEQLRSIAAEPRFEKLWSALERQGYGSEGDRDEIVSELLGKALAGDPGLEATPEQREELIGSLLRAAVDVKGPEILNKLPDLDEVAKKVVEEVRSGSQGNGGETDRGLRGEGQGKEAGQGDTLHAAGEGERPAQRIQQNPQRGAEAEDQLTRFKRMTRALRPEDSLALPGMESADKDRTQAKAEAEGQDLSEEMKKPLGSIEAQAGRMERESPLFAGTDANPQGSLFSRKQRPTTATTGSHDTGKSLTDTIDDLAKLPNRKMTMAEHMEQASDKGVEKVAQAGDMLKNAWQGVKAASAGAWSTWSQPAPWTDYLQSLGDLRKAEFRAAQDIDKYQKELKSVAPTEREREAITIYGEAKDDQQLRRWATLAASSDKFRKYRRAFEAAEHLNERQKAVADAHRRYYDQQLEVLTDAGLLPAGASNYVMHMFASDPATLAQLRSAADFTELAPNPAFLNRRVYKSYFDAIEGGEKPKTLDSGKILSAYHDAFTKTFMTRGFLRSLLYGVDETDGRPIAALESRNGWTLLDRNNPTTDGRILRQPKRPESMDGYVRIPASQLRNFVWEMTDADKAVLAPGYDKMPAEEQQKLFTPDDPRFPVPEGKILGMKGDLVIHPRYADRVADLVTKSWFDRSDSKVAAALKGIQKAGAIAKSVILEASLFHQTQIGVHAMEHMVNPFRLPKLEEMAKDPIIQQGVGHGLNLITVDSEGVLSDLPGMGAYHRYLFRDFIPRIKAQMYKHAFERNVDRFGGGKPGTEAKLTRDEIHLMTAMQANAAFGGLDPAFFQHLNRMNNRTYKAVEHMLMFSPDFTKARGQFVAQAVGKYGTEQRTALLRGALVIYTSARIINAILNRDEGLKGAKWAPQDALNIVTPKSWGRMGGKRYGLRTVQGDLLNLVNDPVQWGYNRLNPVTLRPTIEFLTGRDNFGRQESKEHFFKDYAKQLTPIAVQKLFTTSDEGIISSLLTSAGIQTGNYRSPLEQMAHKMRLSNIPDKPESEEKQDEQRRNVQLVEKMRRGDASTTDLWNLVNQGKLTAREASAIADRANMTELQYDVHHLSLEDAIAVYEKADDQERQELKDIIEAKRDRDLKNYTDEAATRLDDRLKALGIE